MPLHKALDNKILSYLEPLPGPWAELSSSCLNLAKGDWVLPLLAPGEGELQPGDAGLVGDVGVEGSEGALLTRGLTGGDWNLPRNPLPGTSKQRGSILNYDGHTLTDMPVSQE